MKEYELVVLRAGRKDTYLALKWELAKVAESVDCWVEMMV